MRRKKKEVNDLKRILASRNKKKIAEVEALLGGVTLLSLDSIGYAGDIVEDGNSFAENAVIKASVPACMGYAGIADDSGLCVDALNGAPGIYSARFSGENATDADNNAALLRVLSNVPASQRGGDFVCVMAYVCPAKQMPQELRERLTAAGAVFCDAFASEKAGKPLAAFTVEGRCRGRVLSIPQGEDGFGYDPLFYFEQYKKTFAQLTPEEKNAISHRGMAIGAFASLVQIIQDWEKKHADK